MPRVHVVTLCKNHVHHFSQPAVPLSTTQSAPATTLSGDAPDVSRRRQPSHRQRRLHHRRRRRLAVAAGPGRAAPEAGACRRGRIQCGAGLATGGTERERAPACGRRCRRYKSDRRPSAAVVVAAERRAHVPGSGRQTEGDAPPEP